MESGSLSRNLITLLLIHLKSTAPAISGCRNNFLGLEKKYGLYFKIDLSEMCLFVSVHFLF